MRRPPAKPFGLEEVAGSRSFVRSESQATALNVLKTVCAVLRYRRCKGKSCTETYKDSTGLYHRCDLFEDNRIQELYMKGLWKV